MIGQWLGATVGQWLGRVLLPDSPVVVPERGGVVRSRMLSRRSTVRRELQTPDGPLIVMVPEEWTADDLMTLTTALVLTDALN